MMPSPVSVAVALSLYELTSLSYHLARASLILAISWPILSLDVLSSSSFSSGSFQITNFYGGNRPYLFGLLDNGGIGEILPAS